MSTVPPIYGHILCFLKNLSIYGGSFSLSFLTGFLTEPHPTSPVTSFLTARADLGEVPGEETHQKHPPYMGGKCRNPVIWPIYGGCFPNLTVLTG